MERSSLIIIQTSLLKGRPTKGVTIATLELVLPVLGSCAPGYGIEFALLMHDTAMVLQKHEISLQSRSRELLVSHKAGYTKKRAVTVKTVEKWIAELLLGRQYVFAPNNYEDRIYGCRHFNPAFIDQGSSNQVFLLNETISTGTDQTIRCT